MGAMRKFKREVAKNRTKERGLRGVCKKNGRGIGRKHSSWFSAHWREFVPGGKPDVSRN